MGEGGGGGGFRVQGLIGLRNYREGLGFRV